MNTGDILFDQLLIPVGMTLAASDAVDLTPLLAGVLGKRRVDGNRQLRRDRADFAAGDLLGPVAGHGVAVAQRAQARHLVVAAGRLAVGAAGVEPAAGRRQAISARAAQK